MDSKELSDVDAFFAVFEKTRKELEKKGIPAVIANVVKDELGWFAVIRIRPSSTY